MNADIKFDTKGFSLALQELQRVTGKPLRQVLRAEAGSILKTWAGRTKVGTAANARRRATVQAARKGKLTRAENPGDVSVNVGVRAAPRLVWVRSPANRRGGGRPFRLAGGMGDDYRSLTAMRYRWTDAQWAKVSQAVDHMRNAVPFFTKRALKSVGLARQSVVQIADSLGIRLESVPGGGVSAAGIAKARAAIAATAFGRKYENGTGRQYDRAEQFFIELVNRLPYGYKIGMDRTLAAVVNGRARFFRENLKRGVFDQLRTVAQKYPGLFIR